MESQAWDEDTHSGYDRDAIQPDSNYTEHIGIDPQRDLLASEAAHDAMIEATADLDEQDISDELLVSALGLTKKEALDMRTDSSMALRQHTIQSFLEHQRNILEIPGWKRCDRRQECE